MEDTLQHVVRIVAAYLSNNSVRPDEIPQVIATVSTALTDLGKPETTPQEPPQPAVPIRKSVTPDYIVCLEDGKKMKMLKRYLRTNYDMSPEEYRAKWGLPQDYPMAAPAFAARRRQIAHEIGLGTSHRRKAA